VGTSALAGGLDAVDVEPTVIVPDVPEATGLSGPASSAPLLGAGSLGGTGGLILAAVGIGAIIALADGSSSSTTTEGSE
ncbi:MAG: hypothetical protein AAGF13_11630, partial [Pseudomonadota bacterium]